MVQSLSHVCRSGALSRASLLMSVNLFAACGGGSSTSVPPTVSTPVLTVVRVSLSADTIPVGQSAVATIAGLDQSSAPIGVGTPTWSTASPAVATVSAGGVVTAVSQGRTTLIASVNGKQGEIPVTVVEIPIARLSITPAVIRLARGARVQLTAAVLDFSGRVLPGRAIGWSSSDVTRASVTTAGVVTALAPGLVSIAATSEGSSASVGVTVTGAPDSVWTVTVTPAAASLTVGGAMQLVAALADRAGRPLTGRIVTWSASGAPGTNVATVSSSGMVTAVSPGTVIVQAFSEGQHGAATISVKDDVDESIIVTFATPVEDELVGDTLLLAVGVKLPQALASVIAVVGPTRTPHTLRSQQKRVGSPLLWVASIDITDLPAGPWVVEVTATDIRGARGVGSRQFLRDTRKEKGGSSAAPRVK